MWGTHPFALCHLVPELHVLQVLVLKIWDTVSVRNLWAALIDGPAKSSKHLPSQILFVLYWISKQVDLIGVSWIHEETSRLRCSLQLPPKMKKQLSEGLGAGHSTFCTLPSCSWTRTVRSCALTLGTCVYTSACSAPQYRSISVGGRGGSFERTSPLDGAPQSQGLKTKS